MFVRLRPGGDEGLLADEPQPDIDDEFAELLRQAGAPLQVEDD